MQLTAGMARTSYYHPPAAARACFSRSFGTGNNSRSLHGTTADHYYRVVLRLTDCHPRAACRTLTPVSLPVCFCRCRGFSGHTSANATPLSACLLGVVVLPFFAIDRRSVTAASSLTSVSSWFYACKLAVSLVVRAARDSYCTGLQLLLSVVLKLIEQGRGVVD
jgi:hypothetical protein